MYFFSYGHSVSALIMGIYDRPGDSCNHISSSLHLIVTYSRYLETFKCQNVVYTLHGVWSTLHHHLLKNTRRTKHLSLIHISEPTRRTPISYAVFCLKKKKNA